MAPPMPISMILLASGLLALVLSARVAEGCDEALCASLVSKCLLLKSCECDMMDKANCTCCKDCHRCLSALYTECCDCVGMCPSRNSNDYKDTLDQASSIEDLQEPLPALFTALTEDEDPEQRWTVYSYPALLGIVHMIGRMDGKLNLDGDLELGENGRHIRHGQKHLQELNSTGTNCTVAYHSQCMSLNKCKNSCQSMGAARYRWFHKYGCCECVGSTCMHYGKGEALCLKCPLAEDEIEEIGGYYYSEYGYPDEDFYDEDLYKEEVEEEEEDIEEWQQDFVEEKSGRKAAHQHDKHNKHHRKVNG